VTESYYRWDNEDIYLRLRVQPRASRDGVGDVLGDRLKILLTATPVDGKANEHLIRFMARAFGVKRGAVRITTGETGRDKTLRISAPERLPAAFPALARPR
jgi:uncharacterized protein